MGICTMCDHSVFIRETNPYGMCYINPDRPVSITRKSQACKGFVNPQILNGRRMNYGKNE